MNKDTQLFVFSLPLMGVAMAIGIVLLILLRIFSILGLQVFHMLGGMN